MKLHSLTFFILCLHDADSKYICVSYFLLETSTVHSVYKKNDIQCQKSSKSQYMLLKKSFTSTFFHFSVQCARIETQLTQQCYVIGFEKRRYYRVIRPYTQKSKTRQRPSTEFLHETGKNSASIVIFQMRKKIYKIRLDYSKLKQSSISKIRFCISILTASIVLSSCSKQR